MDSRLTELEVKITYAEDQIDELNRTVFRQQQQIDALVAAVESLRQQLQTAHPAEARNLRDDIPPHY